MSSTKRNAFTLIEILVVIAIIGVLASLILGGVMAVRSRGPEAKTRNDILQLSTALDKFYAKYSFYPPDRLRLCSNRTAYGVTTLDSQSVAAITKMWPNIDWRNINWGNRTPWILASTSDDTLEGDQCLLFFLGGLPNGAGPPQGFLTNPAYPAPSNAPTTLVPPQPAVTFASSPTDRLKFMDFEAGRIVLRTGAFPSYKDGFLKQPYVYFSSMTQQKRENGYDPTPIAGLNGVSPYVQQVTPTVKYHKSSQFQIISAGNDGVFGVGGTTATAPSLVQMAWPANSPIPCKDDMSNFNGNKLGAPD